MINNIEYAIERILAAIEDAKQDGVRITTCEWGVSWNPHDKRWIFDGEEMGGEDTCCAIGSLLIKHQPEPPKMHKVKKGEWHATSDDWEQIDAAAALLGVSRQFIEALILGFDDLRCMKDERVYALEDERIRAVFRNAKECNDSINDHFTNEIFAINAGFEAGQTIRKHIGMK